MSNVGCWQNPRTHNGKSAADHLCNGNDTRQLSRPAESNAINHPCTFALLNLSLVTTDKMAGDVFVVNKKNKNMNMKEDNVKTSKVVFLSPTCRYVYMTSIYIFVKYVVTRFTILIWHSITALFVTHIGKQHKVGKYSYTGK